MCGILGGNGKWDYEKGLESLKHRGPDAQRIDNLDGFVLAFARLTIIDVSDRGMQPMFSADRMVGVVFNGEIYGYKKLRKELSDEYCFQSESDSEVILYMYLKYGIDFVKRIDGMFSIAILDKRDEKLLLYRDRLGIKPLYYYCLNGDFLFSSEIKGIVETYKNADLTLDYTALYDYLTYSFVPHPKTLYKHIKKLEPAHRIVYDLKERCVLSNSPYWKLHINELVDGNEEMEDIKAELRSLLTQTVEEQMIADVPVGVMTSGGVDSSIVTYECAKIDPSIETFTIKNTDPRMDESMYAKILTEHLGLRENIILYGKNDLKSEYNNLATWFDEPLADRSAFLSYRLSKEARKKVRVLLSGDGADELFGGYPWLFYLDSRQPYKYDERVSRIYETLSEELCFEEKISTNEKLDDEYLDDISWWCKMRGYMMRREKEIFRYKWSIPDDYDDYWFVRKYYHKDIPPITRLQFVELNTYLPYILNKVDHTSMAASIEVRVPFLARRIVEFAFSLSQNSKFPNGRSKGLLKDAYRNLPIEVLTRSKMGFDIAEDYFGFGKKPQELILRQLWGV